MKPTIYALSKSDINVIDFNRDTFFTLDSVPSPKLIKYGFNSIGNQLNMVAITVVPQYRAGLEIDFNRTDNKSFGNLVAKMFKIKSVNQTFAEFWEIFTLFNLLTTPQRIYSLTEIPELADIIDAYSKLTQSKTPKSIITKDKPTVFCYKYSDVDIDENAAVHFITINLPTLLKSQTPGSSLILQLYSIQTQISIDIINLLSLLYVESYIVKPSAVSDLSDCKYLVLINLIKPVDFKIPTNINASEMYVSGLGLDNLPDNNSSIIQCFNSIIIPKKYKRYSIIKSYLDTKVYEGATYQELIAKQDANCQTWLTTFSDIPNIPQITADAIKISDTSCVKYSELVNVFK